MKNQSTLWKEYEKQGNQKKDEIQSLPIKPKSMLEFKSCREKEKQTIRDSKEWPEIKTYYDQYYDTVQNNVLVYLWEMKIGLRPIGLIPYTDDNTWIVPNIYPTQKLREPGLKR